MGLIQDWLTETGMIMEEPASAKAPHVALEHCLDCIKEYFDCSICRDALHKPIQTKCGHVFCGKCLRELCSKPNATCPLCKQPITNRSLIERDDVGDLMKLVDNLNNVFTVELKKFLDAKDKCKLAVDVGKLSKTPKVSSIERKDGVQRSTPNKSGTRKKLDDKKNMLKKVNLKQIKSNLAELAASGNEGLQNTQEKTNEPLEATKSLNPSKVSNDKLVDQMMNQNYAIISAGVIPEAPLDLSLAQSAQNIKYNYRVSAIRFVKPLDLSTKKEKRKFDDIDETFEKSPRKCSKTTSAPPRLVTPHPQQRKKGKFEDEKQKEFSREAHSSDVKQGSATEGEATGCQPSNSELPDATVDSERPYNNDDDDSPMKEYPPVFTPTPPPAKNLSAENPIDDSPKKNIKRPVIRCQRSNSEGISPNNYISSEIMKDFDLSFDEGGGVSSNGFSPSAEGKISSSDEIYGQITTQYALLHSKGTNQSMISSEECKADNSKAKKMGDSFIFKQPSTSPSQVPKKKSKDNLSLREQILMDFDDDFQQPRDSDLLFLDVTMSDNDSGGNGTEDKKMDSTPGGRTQGSRRYSMKVSGSDSRKENKVRPPSVSGNTKPVKPTSTSNSVSKTLTSTKSKVQDDNVVDIEMFDDEDDEDWLLGIGDLSCKPKSGRTNKGLENQRRASEEKVKSVVPVPSEPQKQRYVFCPSRLTKSQTIKLQQLCKICDGTISKDFTQDVTHLIINLTSGRVPQTLKYLLAIAGRKWIVTYDWVEECVERGKLGYETEFETSTLRNCDPGGRRARLAEENLFEGFKFFFATEIYKSLGFTKSEVTMLLQILGATVVELADSRYRDLIIIGSMNGDLTEYNDWLNTNKWVTVTFSWVIQCVLEYRLKPFEPKYLCVDVSKVKNIHAPKSMQTAHSQYLSQRPGMSPRS